MPFAGGTGADTRYPQLASTAGAVGDDSHAAGAGAILQQPFFAAFGQCRSFQCGVAAGERSRSLQRSAPKSATSAVVIAVGLAGVTDRNRPAC